MSPFRPRLFARFRAGRDAAARAIAGLPAYQVALWPDGWELEPDGAVRVCDTHAMAEARRWYALAGGCAQPGSDRVMALHGVFVPRGIVDLAERRFPCEAAASVAVQLVAGEWVRRRREALLRAPQRALSDRALGWRGSRHRLGRDEVQIGALLSELLGHAVGERLIPDVAYRVRVRRDDCYGIRAHRCRVEVDLDAVTRRDVEAVLRAGLVPWNRAVVRDGAAFALIGVTVSGPRSTASAGESLY
jgi:hypothetical protein